MKRLQIMIDEDLDAVLEREAAAEGTSKAAVIRGLVRRHLQPLRPLEHDPIWDIVGIADGEPGDSATVDDVVYGAGRE